MSTAGSSASAEYVRSRMITAWIESAARLLHADHDPDTIFTTMTTVGIAGLLKTSQPEELAAFLNELADALRKGRDQAEVLDQMERLLAR